MADWKQDQNVWKRADGIQVTLNPNSQTSFVRKADNTLVNGANGAPRPFRSVDDAIAFADQSLPQKRSGWGLGFGR